MRKENSYLTIVITLQNKQGCDSSLHLPFLPEGSGLERINVFDEG